MRSRFALYALFSLVFGTVGATTNPTTSPATTQSVPAKIAQFQGQYRFLSNFWPAEVTYEGVTYPTTEHAYQASKTLDLEARRRIAALPTPAEAKAEGRKLKLRDDWETAKFVVMEEVVRLKFTVHADLRDKLFATGDALLERGQHVGRSRLGSLPGPR